MAFDFGLHRLKKVTLKFLMAMVVAIIIVAVISIVASPKDNLNVLKDDDVNINESFKNNTFAIKITEKTNFYEELPRFFSLIRGLNEVLITDEEGQPMEYLEYFENESYYIPKPIKVNIENIRFFVYKSDSLNLPGESILIKLKDPNQTNLKDMTLWEDTLHYDLKKFILIGEKYDLVEASQKSNYSDSNLSENTRFLNFSKNGEVSLTYTIIEGKILISNNFEIHRKLYPKVFQSEK